MGPRWALVICLFIITKVSKHIIRFLNVPRVPSFGYLSMASVVVVPDAWNILLDLHRLQFSLITSYIIVQFHFSKKLFSSEVST